MIGDKSSDGLCCQYGDGGVVVKNGAGDVLWEAGRYAGMKEVYLNVSRTGDLVWAANNPDGSITDGWDSFWGSGNVTDDDMWEGTDYLEGFDPSVDDEEWPGAFPTPVGMTNAITINMRTDRFPSELIYTWSQRTGPETFEVLESGSPIDSETLVSYDKFVQSETIYHLNLVDTLSDGNCCLFGLGWFTITNSTASGNFTEGTVLWAMTGDELSNPVDAYIWVDANGSSRLAEYLPGQGYGIYELVSGERSIEIVVPEKTDTEKDTKGKRAGSGDMFT
jgi:hypothetical protein